MLKAVLFDMDGTIIDSDLMVVEIWRDLYKKYKPGYKPHLADILSFSGPPLDVSFKKAFPSLDPNEVLSFYRQRVKQYYDDLVISFDGMRETLEELKRRGYKLGVVTNKAKDFALYSLELCLLDGLFDVTIGGDDVMKNKPDPEGIYKALSALKVMNKKEAVYIGDTEYDLLAAKNAGISFFLASWCLRPTLEGVEERDVFHKPADLLRRL